MACFAALGLRGPSCGNPVRCRCMYICIGRLCLDRNFGVYINWNIYKYVYARICIGVIASSYGRKYRRFGLNGVKIFGHLVRSAYLCTTETSRSRAVVAHRAHNPKVVGSSPASATNHREVHQMMGLLLFYTFFCDNGRASQKI